MKRVDDNLQNIYDFLRDINENNYKWESHNPISHIQTEIEQLRKVTNTMASSHEEFTHRLRDFFDEIQRRKSK